jgi:hypothetical protein
LTTYADSNFINDWKYYRVTAIAQSNIEVCEVEFPSLRDSGKYSAVTSPSFALPGWRSFERNRSKMGLGGCNARYR